MGAEEAQNYANMWNARKGINVPPCCDEDNFRYDLLGTPRSPWNQSAARVFAVAFRRWAQADLDHTATTDAFFTWIKSLKQNYKKSQLNAAEQGRAQSLARRKTRKRAVCQFSLADYPLSNYYMSSVVSFTAGSSPTTPPPTASCRHHAAFGTRWHV